MLTSDESDGPDDPADPDSQPALATLETVQTKESSTGFDCPTYEDACQKMIALKTKYPEGKEWTNFTPYKAGNVYWWHGGDVKGGTGGVGCAAFDNLPARVIDKGGFTFDDVKVGDILRINNNSHFVIVLLSTFLPVLHRWVTELL